jgi:hypothetical protein
VKTKQESAKKTIKQTVTQSENSVYQTDISETTINPETKPKTTHKTMTTPKKKSNN